MALEAGVAWEVLRRGRRVCEVARRGPGSSYRVGKNKIVVKRRGVPDGLFQGAPWCRWRVFPREVRGAAGGSWRALWPPSAGPAYPRAAG